MSRKYAALAIGLTLAAFAASVMLYPRLPAEIPIHWNIHGQVDNQGSKTWAAFLAPCLMVFMIVLFRFLPWLSPRRFEVSDTGKPTYLYVMVVLLVLLAYLHGLTLAAALGRIPDVGRALVAGLCLIFALLGNVLGKIPRNMYIGVRTPWTIASERVWYATHRLAAKLLVAAGIAGVVMVLAFGWFSAAFVVLMASLLVPVVYSLVYYKRLDRGGDV